MRRTVRGRPACVATGRSRACGVRRRWDARGESDPPYPGPPCSPEIIRASAACGARRLGRAPQPLSSEGHAASCAKIGTSNMPNPAAVS